MTQVILHGILAKEFRKSFSLAIKRPKEVFDAISCSHDNFRNRIVELSNQGIHFALLVDGKKTTAIEDASIASGVQKIDIVPVICGTGVVAAVVGVALAVGGFAVGGMAFAGAAFLGNLMMSVGVGIAMMGIQNMLAPKPEIQRPESTVDAVKQSFMFGSKTNVADQGFPVPVGYGRLRVGSSVIQATVKSYPQGFEKTISLKTDGQLLNNDL